MRFGLSCDPPDEGLNLAPFDCVARRHRVIADVGAEALRNCTDEQPRRNKIGKNRFTSKHDPLTGVRSLDRQIVIAESQAAGRLDA